jgi:hypothetical protein
MITGPRCEDGAAIGQQERLTAAIWRTADGDNESCADWLTRYGEGGPCSFKYDGTAPTDEIIGVGERAGCKRVAFMRFCCPSNAHGLTTSVPSPDLDGPTQLPTPKLSSTSAASGEPERGAELALQEARRLLAALDGSNEQYLRDHVLFPLTFYSSAMQPDESVIVAGPDALVTAWESADGTPQSACWAEPRFMDGHSTREVFAVAAYFTCGGLALQRYFVFRRDAAGVWRLTETAVGAL